MLAPCQCVASGHSINSAVPPTYICMSWYSNSESITRAGSSHPLATNQVIITYGCMLHLHLPCPQQGLVFCTVQVNYAIVQLSGSICRVIHLHCDQSRYRMSWYSNSESVTRGGSSHPLAALDFKRYVIDGASWVARMNIQKGQNTTAKTQRNDVATTKTKLI